jgi:type IV pilus assembly protein PilO
MATKSKVKIDLSAQLARLQSQFRGLNPNDPSSWPALPRTLLAVAVTVLVVVLLWFLWLNDSDTELQTDRAKEVTLRAEYKQKVAQAVNLDALKKQREQVLQYVTQLEKQLPARPRWMRCCRISTRLAWAAVFSSTCSARGRSSSKTTMRSFPSRCA